MKKSLYLLVVFILLIAFVAAFVKAIKFNSNQIKCPNCNIVIISIDTLRPDFLNTYNSQKKLSPNIDELAMDSFVFNNAYTTSPIGRLAHSSLFTSKYPQNSKLSLPNVVLKESEVTLAEILKKSGYLTQTIALQGEPLGPREGLDQGFDNRILINKPDYPDDAHEVFTKAKDFIKANANHKFFLFTHTFQPHSPYGDSNPKARSISELDAQNFIAENKNGQRIHDFLEEVLSKYEGDVTYTDQQLKQVLDQLKESSIEDRTIVVITSDHGEEFYEHGKIGIHWPSLYEEVIKIPLIIHVPKEPSKRIQESVSIVDILPTILSLTGIHSDSNFQGYDLSPVINGKERKSPFIFSQRIQEDKDNYVSAVRFQDWKLIENYDKSYNLYNLKNDPKEQTDIGSKPEYTKIFNQLEKKLQDFENAN